jgi:hypothetical protein
VLTVQNEMSNPKRGPSIDASYQILVNLASEVSEEKIFLEIDQPETRIA